MDFYCILVIRLHNASSETLICDRRQMAWLSRIHMPTLPLKEITAMYQMTKKYAHLFKRPLQFARNLLALQASKLTLQIFLNFLVIFKNLVLC